MHKLAKGLKGPKEKKEKKAKKGKKSKKKDEELFKPEELEAYRREHAASQSGEASAQNEEWKKFLSLTSGVDTVLKKTQDDLDRIRSTSFFQRVPPPSEVAREKQEEEHQKQAEQKALREQQQVKEEPVNFGIVEVSESESEEEEDDDIFDTAYIDAVAAGEIKLAYIPDSPTDNVDADDPFDTTIAERAILGPEVERKGKKLVPLGAAVEVLTGRVQLPTCATKAVPRRQAYKEQNLLLQSFDSVDPVATAPAQGETKVATPVKTLLDDDIPKPESPIDLSKSLYIPPPPPEPESKPLEDEADLEFEALAAESLSKAPTAGPVTLPVIPPIDSSAQVIEATDWKPFGETEKTDQNSLNEEDFEVDPFDTTFAENLLPGKAELKVLEKEILENDIDFDPRAEESFSAKLGVLNSNNRHISLASTTTTIQPAARDLLGGSTTDLSTLSDTLQPAGDETSYRDPFDTSIVETVTQPGKAELKFLERELLSDIKKPTVATWEDDDFDPRANEKPRERTFSRPDVLNISSKKQVSFDEPDKNCLGVEGSKIAKPLTPFYVRKNSVPGVETVTELPGQELDDPFDTSFVNSAPGKAEIKVLETELFQKTPEEFKETIILSTANQSIEIKQPKVDLLAESHNIQTKVLTPAPQIETQSEEISYKDPFDTSIVSTLAPGKAELKLLENELIENNCESKQDDDLLVHRGDVIIEKPLSPQISTDFEEDPNFDPFDTSFATNIQPGKAELRALESELM